MRSLRTMRAKEWIAGFAEQLGTDPPTGEEFKAILDLAADAAHSSERMAAPVATWLSARAGYTPEEAIELARRVTGKT
jgi:Domain of unknown function (DUF6457)